MDTTGLIDSYCAAWSEPDPARRSALLRTVWAENAVYLDPRTHTVGVEALLAHIANVQASRPGTTVARTSEPDIHHGMARFSWRATDADGGTLLKGIDIAFFNVEGSRIERIIGFFDP